MADDNSKTEKKKSSNYSKRPLWHWAVLYLLAGAIVYFLIYWYILRDSASYS